MKSKSNKSKSNKSKSFNKIENATDENIYYKKKIPKKVKEEVWVSNIGKYYQSKCYIKWCSNNMNVFNFHVGHDIPESKGGTDNINNLKPICDRCNLSMGNQNTIKEWNNRYNKNNTIFYNYNLLICLISFSFTLFICFLYNKDNFNNYSSIYFKENIKNKILNNNFNITTNIVYYIAKLNNIFNIIN